jgi:hypothetical protein
LALAACPIPCIAQRFANQCCLIVCLFLQLTSPGSAVCLLGLCFGWAGFGWAQTAMSSSGELPKFWIISLLLDMVCELMSELFILMLLLCLCFVPFR